jgi:cation-transporting ATPase 13A3/4/5
VPDLARPDLARGGDRGPLTDFISIIRRFDFDSKLQRMSVISRNYVDTQIPYHYFIKGSPEKIKELANAHSIPVDFDYQLEEYTQRGYRVIALAHKPAPKNLTVSQLMVLPREEIEKDLTFLGFLIMENKLKPPTVRIIQELNSANVRTVLATGDNMLTALSVGKKCGIVKENHTVYLGDLTEDEE